MAENKKLGKVQVECHIENSGERWYICVRDNGSPYGSVKTAFKAAPRWSGIGYFRVHDLRHTFAARLVLGGVSLPVAK